MTQEHPITPPPELFKQWFKQWEDDILNERDSVDHVLDRAWRDGFQSGADQELEACVEWVINTRAYDMSPGALRAARRPKPPSLKEQALALIDECTDPHGDYLDDNALTIIRRALEALPDD